MSLPLIRLTAAWMAHAEYGVNAVLPIVPRDADDPEPTPIAAIYNRAQHPWVARGLIPRTDPSIQRPCLIVTTPKPSQWNPSVRTASPGGGRLLEGLASVAVQYVTHATATHEGVRDASYALRAVRGSLLLLARRPLAERKRAGVQFPLLTELTDVETYEEKEDVTVTGILVATWTVQETTPLGAFPGAIA